MAKNSNIECPSCNRHIVPRLIVEAGAVKKQVCPFCLTRLDESAWAIAFDNMKYLGELVPDKLRFPLIGILLLLLYLS